MGILALLTLAASLGLAGETPSKYVPPVRSRQGLDEKLRHELLERMRLDQEARKPILRLLQKNKSVDLDELKKTDSPDVTRLKKIDRGNTNRMKQIVKQFGWPGMSLVRTDGANAAWILVQHADHDREFQKECLGLLEKAVKGGEATGEQLAYLTDRVRLAEKKTQVYGTQIRIVGGKMQSLPIDDEANVDQRRKLLGLMPLALYLKFSQWAFDLAAKDKSLPK